MSNSNDIFKTFSNYETSLILNDCCTTDKCKEKKCYENCITCDSGPFCFTPPQLPCQIPKAIRKAICVKGKLMETFLNQAFCTILEAINTGDFSTIVPPEGINLLLLNFSDQSITYSSFPNPPSALEVNFLILSAFSRNDDDTCNSSSKIKLKFLMKNQVNTPSFLQSNQFNSLGNNNTIFGGSFSATSKQLGSSGDTDTTSGYGVIAIAS